MNMGRKAYFKKYYQLPYPLTHQINQINLVDLPQENPRNHTHIKHQPQIQMVINTITFGTGLMEPH
jgi:hypothetical protein